MNTFVEWRARVHLRVCIPARSCTCPEVYDGGTLAEARRRARETHERFDHPGLVENCQSPDDVICKAVYR